MSAPVVDVPVATASAPARGAAWLAIAAVAVGVLLAPPGVGGASLQGVGEVVAGEVEALRSGAWTSLPVGTEVRRDEPLRTGTGTATLRVRGGELSLAPGSRVALDRDTTELSDGSVLFAGDAVRTVEFGATDIRGRGAFRVDASPSARVGVYHGGVAVADGERQRSLGAYEQVDLTDGRAREVVALRYVAEDPWDARMLAGALAIDHQVHRTVVSLRAVYGTGLQQPGFYRDFIAVDDVLAGALPELSPIAQEGSFGPPAETLVAVIVTRLLVERGGLDVAEATAQISAHRRAGATWGLVLRHHDLRADDLRSGADTALRSRAIAVEEGSAVPVEVGPAPGAGEDPAETPPTGTPDDDGPEDGDGGDGGDPDGVPDGDDEPGDGDGDDGEGDDGDGDDPIEDVVDEVDDVIDELPLPGDPPGLGDLLDRGNERSQERRERRPGRAVRDLDDVVDDAARGVFGERGRDGDRAGER